jgi:hypothetical protein
MSKRASSGSAQAKQRSGKARSGGGLTMSKNVSPGYRGGKRTLDAISVEAVVGLGTRTAYPKPDLVKAKPADFVEMGNTRAASCAQGPGGGRTVYKTGFQSLRGPVSQGEGNMEGRADRGVRAILGEKGKPQP